MKISGSAVVTAPLQRVWDALQDPAVLVRTIPGCEALETVGPDVYRMTVSAGVASIKGVYQGQVTLADPEPPTSFTLRAQGQGAPGTVDATVRVRLSAIADDQTQVDYDADAVVGGMIGGVGQRMITSVAKKTAAEFFDAVSRTLAEVPAGVAASTGGAVQANGAGPGVGAPVPAAAAEAAPARPAVGQVFRAPEKPRRPEDVRAYLLGAAFGAAIALAGVLVGAAVARRGGGSR